MGNSARKERKRSGEQFAKAEKVGTPVIARFVSSNKQFTKNLNWFEDQINRAEARKAAEEAATEE